MVLLNATQTTMIWFKLREAQAPSYDGSNQSMLVIKALLLFLMHVNKCSTRQLELYSICIGAPSKSVIQKAFLCNTCCHRAYCIWRDVSIH